MMIQATGSRVENDFPAAILELVDKAVSIDFTISPIDDADRSNDRYTMTKMAMIEQLGINIVYERKVVTSIGFLPRVQYLFGFDPREGVCLLVNKRIHKMIACGGKLAELNQKCILVNHLQFLLAQSDTFRYWAYIPPCLCKVPCELLPAALSMRVSLFVEEDV